MANYKGYRDLECYQQARELRQMVSALLQTFPKEERFQLTAQLRRSSRSVTANIAEGYGRYTFTDTKHFFIIARGSVTESMEHLLTAFDENYISKEVLTAHEAKCETVLRLINGFITYLKASKLKSQLPKNT